MEIVYRLQQSTSTCKGTCIGGNTGTCDGTGEGTNTSSGTSTSAGAWDLGYCLATHGLVRFRDKIYVSDNSDLKEVSLIELHAKTYSGHPGYQKTLKGVKRYYYWLNLKRDVLMFVVRCFDYQ